MNVVLGGGVSGLSAAFYLSKSASSAKVLVVEASERVGGWVRSVAAQDNIIFEQGPRTIRPRGPPGANTLSLVEELGLKEEVKPILSTHPSARNRMLFIDGQLHVLPSSITGAVRTLLRRPYLLPPICVHVWKDISQQAKPPRVSDESIYSFVERHMSRGAADYLISPVICGICAGDAREISVKFLLKSMFEGVQEHGSISKWLIKSAMDKNKTLPSDSVELSSLAKRAKEERWSVWSLSGGLETLPRALYNKIQERNVEVHLGKRCSQIIFDKKGARIMLNGGNEYIQANHIISSLPANRLAPILKSQHPDLSAELEAIPNVTVAVVNLAFKGDKLLKHDAFGFLIPPLEDKPILGVIFDSCSFPQEGHTVLTIMMGGRWFSSRFGDSPSESMLLETATNEVTKILGLSQKPVCSKVTVLRDCIPQYVVGHHDRVNWIREYVKERKLPLSLVGASYDGVGVNDVIFSAKQGVEGMLAH